jgi:hypothetical protein
VGTETGFVVYDTTTMALRFRQGSFVSDSFSQLTEFGKGLGIVEPYFKSNVVALVGGGKNPKWPSNQVILWDDHLSEAVAQIECDYPVCGVRFSLDRYKTSNSLLNLRIFVVVEYLTYEFSLENLKLLKKYPTVTNPLGRCQRGRLTY